MQKTEKLEIQHTRIHKNQEGFIALIIVMLIASVTLIFGLSVALMTSDELISSQGWLSSARVIAFGRTCADDMLSRLRNNTNMNSGTLNISSAPTNCNATVDGSGNMRNIVVRSTSTDNFNRNYVYRGNLNVNITTKPFTISSYKDILTE